MLVTTVWKEGDQSKIIRIFTRTRGSGVEAVDTLAACKPSERPVNLGEVVSRFFSTFPPPSFSASIMEIGVVYLGFLAEFQPSLRAGDGA